jgi:hypothetical protein
MNGEALIRKMVEYVGDVPSEAEVFALQRHSLEDTERRAKQCLATVAEAYTMSLDRGDWLIQKDRTLVRLPRGARAVIYHASGTMKLVTGLNPMDSLFERMDDRDSLTKLVEQTADKLKIHSWVGQKEKLTFERLWQIKASGADPNGRVVDPVLCRIVGAYRHVVGELPVWGAASVAVKLAGGGVLDSITIQTRDTTGDVVDKPEILKPEQAARQIYLQLSSLMSNSKINLDESAVPQWMRFGYLSLNKHKYQRLLAPVYISAIEIEGQEEAQAYLFVTSGTEKTYLPLGCDGNQAATTFLHRGDS